MEEIIEFGTIVLKWSPWYLFKDVLLAKKIATIILPIESGVYEVVEVDEDGVARLDIGKTSCLDRRIRVQLVKGRGHSAGEKIKKAFPNPEEHGKLLVRYAMTDRPAAVEEELHRRHRHRYGDLPLYTDR